MSRKSVGIIGILAHPKTMLTYFKFFNMCFLNAKSNDDILRWMNCKVFHQPSCTHMAMHPTIKLLLPPKYEIIMVPSNHS